MRSAIYHDRRLPAKRWDAKEAPMSDASLDVSARIQAAWAKGADVYDEDPGHGLMTAEVQRVWMTVLREALGDPPLDVLDVGTGTGALAVLVAQGGHRVSGVDITPAMLARAGARAAAADVSVAWREGDAMALPFDDASFDAVVSRNVLWTMTDPAAAFREWIRVVRTGGRVIWFGGLGRQHGPDIWLRRRLSEVVRRLQRWPDHAAPHHYTPDLYDFLPLRGISTVDPIVEVLRGVGVTDPSFRTLPELKKTELRAQPFFKRVADAGTRYAGWFPVTAELRSTAPIVDAGRRDR